MSKTQTEAFPMLIEANETCGDRFEWRKMCKKGKIQFGTFGSEI
jgi:hypothetical protein